MVVWREKKNWRNGYVKQNENEKTLEKTKMKGKKKWEMEEQWGVN